MRYKISDLEIEEIRKLIKESRSYLREKNYKAGNDKLIKVLDVLMNLKPLNR